MQRVGALEAGWELAWLALRNASLTALEQAQLGTQPPAPMSSYYGERWAPLCLISQNTGKGFTCSGGKLLPQELLGAGFSSRHKQLCPSCTLPDTLSTRDHTYFFL